MSGTRVYEAILCPEALAAADPEPAVSRWDIDL
jgi:hypothetical protein